MKEFDCCWWANDVGYCKDVCRLPMRFNCRKWKKLHIEKKENKEMSSKEPKTSLGKKTKTFSHYDHTLDVLAENLYSFLGNKTFNVTWFRELLQLWHEKHKPLKELEKRLDKITKILEERREKI